MAGKPSELVCPDCGEPLNTLSQNPLGHRLRLTPRQQLCPECRCAERMSQWVADPAIRAAAPAY